MSKPSGLEIRQAVDDLYRTDSRRVFATLIRLLGNFDLAEEALHDAFAAAAEQWPQQGMLANPRAWLVSTGRFKAIDTLRRRQTSRLRIITFLLRPIRSQQERRFSRIR